jgi:hypothetical protein
MSSDWHVTGAQSVLVYATMYGSSVGWDLRAPGTAWKLENDLKRGKYDIVEVRKVSFPTPTEETVPALQNNLSKSSIFL